MRYTFNAKLLAELSERFLAEGIDDPTLNHALLEALCGDFDLCGEFKRLFVYIAVNRYSEKRLEKVDDLPAWALNSRKFHMYLPLVQPYIVPPDDIMAVDDTVCFARELVR